MKFKRYVLVVWKMKILYTIRKIVPTLGLRRKSYYTRSNVFLEKDIIVKDPLDLFNKWFEEASSKPKSILEPNAMCLSTATRDGKPSGRYMLCKAYSKEGFQFYTNLASRKGQELEENPNAAITFFWPVLSKCVRIEGHVKQLSSKEASDYFKTRPYPNQIGALSSNQSKVVESRDCLIQTFNQMEDKYKEGKVPKPESWGGYIVIPTMMEFWQGQMDRIHDRIRFRKPKEGEVPDNIISYPGVDGWIYERLQP